MKFPGEKLQHLCSQCWLAEPSSVLAAICSASSCKPSPGAAGHSIPAATASQHLQPSSQSCLSHAHPALFWGGLCTGLCASPGSLQAFFSELRQWEVPQHDLGQSSQAPVPAEELQSSAHLTCRSAAAREPGTAQLAEIWVLIELIGVEDG